MILNMKLFFQFLLVMTITILKAKYSVGLDPQVFKCHMQDLILAQAQQLHNFRC